MHLAECIVRRRDAYLCQSVGEVQRDGIRIFARARTAQQIGKTLALVAEVDGAVRGGVPGGDGVVVAVVPVQGFFGSDGVVVMHGVGADLFLAVYLHGEPVARVKLAAVAVLFLADARRRCAPGLCLAALHAKGDAGYLQRVLSFGQPGIIRQLVLRAGCRCEENRTQY